MSDDNTAGEARRGRGNKRTVTRYWWERHVPGFSLMTADLRRHDYPPHIHDAFVIAVTERGGSMIRSRGVSEPVDQALLFVSNPAEPQSSWMGDIAQWRYRSFYLDAAGTADIAATLGIGAGPHFTRNFLRDADLIRRFLALHRMFEANDDTFGEREQFIQGFAALFERHGSGRVRIEAPPRDSSLARRAVEVIRARHADALRLDELAAAVGLTPFQLIGLFKRTLGLTPHAYLVQTRLEAARRLLARGTPIAHAAASSGFCDQSALHRHFRRCYGLTPKQFVRSAPSRVLHEPPRPFLLTD